MEKPAETEPTLLLFRFRGLHLCLFLLYWLGFSDREYEWRLERGWQRSRSGRTFDSLSIPLLLLTLGKFFEVSIRSEFCYV
jgi:hypothetical protein